MRPSWEGSPAGRGVPARPQPLESRGAERLERSSAAAATPPQVKGHVQSHCRGAIPGAQVLQFSGGPRLPAGLPRSAPRARGPGAEPAHGPGQQAHQPRLRASARQAANSSSAPDATTASQKGSLHRLVVLSRPKGTSLGQFVILKEHEKETEMSKIKNIKASSEKR
ncbi:hypothetical protein NDU88_006565 [Pleurodeles waltl]|uniref:Uncharacterized protein n=1 Tax=Pleurodeles waltl TaxID=8319 RepID=A0AAV7NTN4_PLEWA|nr:hypothetical protein NDU88_006565 [Pleurodeles waltl]